MDFLITNFKTKKSKKVGDLFCLGTCVKSNHSGFVISESSDWRYFSSYDKNLAILDPSKKIDFEDFYFLAKYDIENDSLTMQTDLIAYETCYCYRDNNFWGISDDVLSLIEALAEINIKIEIDEQFLREYLAFNNVLLDNTVYKGIKRLQPAAIYQIKVSSFSCSYHIYNNFQMDGTLKTPEESACMMYKCMDTYFKSHFDESTEYSIGLSGGLDSRVGAYFAVKNNYNLKPNFIGIENNSFGLKTYDAKRACEVANFLHIKKDIVYYDPRNLSFFEKVKFDALNSPTMVDNIGQNLGTITKDYVLINGIIGGDMIGYFVDDEIINYDDLELSKYILTKLSNLPQVKSQFIRRVSIALKLKCLAKINKCPDSVHEELITKEQFDIALKRIFRWVLAQKKMGLDNINIWHKFYMYNIASVSKTSYYASYSNTVPSLPTFLNQLVVERALLHSRTDSILSEMPIQKELFKKLDGLGAIRSQKVACCIDDKDKKTEKKRILYIIERIIRGSGMEYFRYISDSDISSGFRSLISPDMVTSKINLKSSVWNTIDRHVVLSLLKIAYIEKQILDFNRK